MRGFCKPARRLAWRAAAPALLLLLGCRRPQEGVPTQGSPPGAAQASSPQPAGAAAPARTSAPWREALAEPDDALRLLRLAEAEGASGLVEALADGGPAASVALLALPHADDAELAVDALAARLAGADAAALAPLLDSLEGVALRPRTQTEPLAPGAWPRAHEALALCARRSELAPSLRARAVSVARLLSDRTPPGRSPLPADFDR